MDTSQMRVTMCEKAEELQMLWKPGVGDWFYKRDGIGFGLWLICKIEEGILLCSGERMSQPPFNRQFVEFRVPEQYIWLPRQDQLQEMVKFEHDRQGGTRLTIGEMVTKIDIFYFRDEPIYSKQFISMEQLWLAFLMKQKYNKVWNGEDWGKQHSRGE